MQNSLQGNVFAENNFLPRKVLFNRLSSGFSEESPLLSEFYLNITGLALVTAPKWAQQSD